MQSQEQLTALIGEHMKRLPPEVKDIIAGFDWLETLKSLSASYKLNIEQQGILGTEVTLSILGIIHPDEFSHELRNSLNLGKEQTENLIVDINEKIFRPIRAKLIGVYNRNQEWKAKQIAGEEIDGFEEVKDTTYEGEEIVLKEKEEVTEESKPLPDIGSPLNQKQAFVITPQNEEQKPVIATEQNEGPAPVAFITNKLQNQETITFAPKTDSLSESAIKSKLGGIFSKEVKETDHSLENKTSGSINHTLPSTDPYREAV